MKKSRLFFMAAFAVATIAAFGSKANSKLVTQFNYKNQDNNNVCTFLQNTDPCGGGSNICTVTVGGHSGVTVYRATSLQCTTIDMTKP